MTATADALMAIFGFKRVEGSEMTKKNDGGPAFPFGQTDADSGQLVNGWGSEGMTLRDYFAAKAMQGFLANPERSNTRDVAKWAYSAADAMLAAREQQQ